MLSVQGLRQTQYSQGRSLDFGIETLFGAIDLTKVDFLLQHTLVETEAENIRVSIINAMQKMTQFMETLRDTTHRTGGYLTFASKSFDKHPLLFQRL